jgi:hypothetical protein
MPETSGRKGGTVLIPAARRGQGINSCSEDAHKEIECEAVDWIHMAQEMDQCQALVNGVKNLLVQ